jgi:hypothetical protein
MLRASHLHVFRGAPKNGRSDGSAGVAQRRRQLARQGVRIRPESICIGMTALTPTEKRTFMQLTAPNALSPLFL